MVLIFTLSVLGAYYIAEGDVIVGIFAFFVTFGILNLVKWIVHKIKSETGPYPPPPTKESNIHIILDEKSFVSVHNQVMSFLEIYSEKLPDEWLHYFVSQEFEHVGDTTFGYVKFEISLGNWWDELFFDKPEILDYMKSIFTFDDNNKTFTYKMISGTCSNCSFNQNLITEMIHEYISHYESEHPHVKFERRSWGAMYSNV